jgi:hypothetical protein
MADSLSSKATFYCVKIIREPLHLDKVLQWMIVDVQRTLEQY